VAAGERVEASTYMPASYLLCLIADMVRVRGLAQ